MTEYVSRGLGQVSKKNAAATLASVEPHLEPGEDVLTILAVRPMGGRWSTLTFARLEVTPAAVELPKMCTLAVTPRRFLVVSHLPGTDEPSALLITRPLDEVRSVQMGRTRGAKQVSWTAGGTQYVVSANGQCANEIVQALQPGMATD